MLNFSAKALTHLKQHITPTSTLKAAQGIPKMSFSFSESKEEYGRYFVVEMEYKEDAYYYACTSQSMQIPTGSSLLSR